MTGQPEPNLEPASADSDEVTLNKVEWTIPDGMTLEQLVLLSYEIEAEQREKAQNSAASTEARPAGAD